MKKIIIILSIMLFSFYLICCNNSDEGDNVDTPVLDVLDLESVWKEEYLDKQNDITLENIKDAGNLGTILRTASAFNYDAVVLFGDTVDLYNPKCVRSAVGNLWKKPVICLKDFNMLKEYFTPFERIATLPKGKDVVNLKDFKTSRKMLIMFGSEANGLTEQLKNFATKNLTIEMASSVESLNLSVSAAVIMYQLM